MRRYEVIEPFERICPRCGAKFMTTSSNPRTCCPECRKAKRRACRAEEQRRRRERIKKRRWREPLPPPAADCVVADGTAQRGLRRV